MTRTTGWARTSRPALREDTKTREYQEGLTDARRGTPPEKRIATFQAKSTRTNETTRAEWQGELAEVTRQEKEKDKELADAASALAQRPPTMSSAVLAYAFFLLAGWGVEVGMIYPSVEVLAGPFPLLAWLGAVGFAVLAPLLLKFAIGERAPLHDDRLRPAFAAAAACVVLILSNHRAQAVHLEAQMGDSFVAAFVGQRLWLTVLTLLTLNVAMTILIGTVGEMLDRDRRTKRLRKIHTNVNRTVGELRSKRESLEHRLAALERGTASELGVLVADYELGYAHGVASGVADPREASLLKRGMEALRALVPLMLLMLSLTGCTDSFSTAPNSITSVIPNPFNTIPKNTTVVVLDPYGAAPLPKDLAMQVSWDVVSRSGRCSTLLFITPNGFQAYEQSYRLVIPCSASRSGRDSDLNDVYTTFQKEFGTHLDAWWQVKDPHKAWAVDYVGTLRRVSEDLQLAEGKRIAVVLSGLWWIDEKAGPPALGPLPALDFSRTAMYLGFTHGFSDRYRYWLPDGQERTFSSMPAFIDAWGAQFKRWKAEPLTTAAFGPQNARQWISRHIGSETDAYRKWRRANPIERPRATPPSPTPSSPLFQSPTPRFKV
jgi:hypothetical protein